MKAETAKEQDIPELPSSDSESESYGKKGKNGQKCPSNYKEILNEVKHDVGLIKSKLLKRDSEGANDAVDKLNGLIAVLTEQLAFVKGKLLVPLTVEEAENFAQVAQRFTEIKENR